MADAARRAIGLIVGSARELPTRRSGPLAGFEPAHDTELSDDTALQAVLAALVDAGPHECRLGRLRDGRAAGLVRARDGAFHYAVVAKQWKEANRRIRVRDLSRGIRVLGEIAPLPDEQALAAWKRMLRGLDAD